MKCSIQMINYVLPNILIVVLSYIPAYQFGLFSLSLYTNNFKKSSKARFGHMQVLHFYFSSNLVWKRRYFPRDLTENARATCICCTSTYTTTKLRAFRIKKGELKTFFTRVFVKFMWLFYSPKQFWVVNTFYHSMSTYHIYIQHCGLICMEN